MSDMSKLKLSEAGLINALLIPLIIVVLLLAGAGAFGIWAYGGRQDYKNNVDKKIATAVAKARDETQAADQARFDQQEKSPYKTYVGLAEFGALTVIYPKTWAGFILERGGGNAVPIDAYFYPNFVPDIQNGNNAAALRMQILQQSYSTVLSQYSGLENSKKVTVTPYRLPKLPGIAGVRIDGEIVSKKRGSLILVPLRNLTVRVWTESNSYVPDFDNIILPNLVFSP